MTEVFYPQPTIHTINMQDILEKMQYNYALVLAICSMFIFIYIMMNIFIKNFNTWKWKNDFDDVVIFASVFVLIISLTYLLNFKGI